jgi:hypothetical protein
MINSKGWRTLVTTTSMVLHGVSIVVEHKSAFNWLTPDVFTAKNPLVEHSSRFAAGKSIISLLSIVIVAGKILAGINEFVS